MFRFHRSLPLFMLLVIILALPPVMASAAPAGQSDLARVQFVNATVDVPGLDGYVDTVFAAGNLNGASGYMDIAAGDHTFSFRLTNGAEALVTVDATVEPGQWVTVAALNTQQALEAKVFVDTVTAPGRNAAQVKVIHAAPDTAPINVTLGEVSLASGLSYGQASDTAQVFAGSYDLVVTDSNNAPVASEFGRVFTDNKVYNIFVVGSAEAYRIVVGEGHALKPNNTTSFRFANLAQGVGTLAVHINKEAAPLYPAVAMGDLTNYFVTGTGLHLFEVYPMGQGPQTGAPLASGSATIGLNDNVVFVAQGTPDNLQVVAYTADFSPLRPGATHVQVIHLAIGNPAIRMELTEGSVLVDRVEPMAVVNDTMPAGVYNVRLVDADSGETVMERNVRLTSGMSKMFFIYDDNPEEPRVSMLEVDVENVPQHAAVRWANLNALGPAVDFYLDGTLAAAGLAYKQTSDYLLYEPKVYTVALFEAGADPATTDPLFSMSVELLGDNFPRTIYAYGDATQSSLEFAPDALEFLPPGTARVRFINAAVNSGAVDVINPTDGTLAANDLNFGQYGANANVAGGVYTFNFSAEVGGIASIQGITIEAGKVYTIVLAGVLGQDPGLETIVLEAIP